MEPLCDVTVIFNIYIDLVSFEARVQVVHQGLLRHRLQAAQVVHSQLAVAGGRSTGPTRTSRFWNRKCVIVFQIYFRCKKCVTLFQMQKFEFGKSEFWASHGWGESGGVSLSLVLTSWNLIYRVRWFLRANINFYFVWSSTALFSPSPGLKRRKVEVTLIFHAWLAT